MKTNSVQSFQPVTMAEVKITMCFCTERSFDLVDID